MPDRSFLRVLWLGAMLALLVPVLGCSTPTRTVTTTETVECTPPDADGERECHTVSRRTEVEEPGDLDFGCDGIVSCGFGAVGQVIALPFRILGVVFDVIF